LVDLGYVLQAIPCREIRHYIKNSRRVNIKELTMSVYSHYSFATNI